MSAKKVKSYTNSVQHNVLATVIDNLNDNNGLTYLIKNKIGSPDNKIIKEHEFKISTLRGMCEILDEIHLLGYKIVKGK